MSEKEVWREAKGELGGEMGVRKITGRARAVAWGERMWRDVKYGARSLRKSPGFTAVALITLALGIGAPTAIFSVIDSVMLRPLPFSEPDQLVRISAIKNGRVVGAPSPLDMRDLFENSHTFQQIATYDVWRKNVSLGQPGSEPEQMAVGLMPAEYFEALKVSPLMGRLFAASESLPGENYVAAISAGLWKTRFAADAKILGRKILINDEPYRIIGVMPDAIPDWVESRRVDVWTPFAVPTNSWIDTARGPVNNSSPLGRLKAGVTLEQAQADLSTVMVRLAQAYPVDGGMTIAVRPLADTRVGTLRPALILLMGAVSLILLIACSNLGNLLLARNSVRERELAVRAALGASSGDLVRRLLTETLLLTAGGAALGLLFAQAAVRALARMQGVNLVQLAEAKIHSGVLIFTLAISLAASVIFGLAPTFAAARVNLTDAMKEGGRSGSTGRRGQAFRNALVVSEVALSLMLLVGAGLLMQSLFRLQSQAIGIRADHLMKGHFYMPPARYADSTALTNFCDEFGRRVRALPGVTEASVTTLIPPDGTWTQFIELQGNTFSRLPDVPTARFGLSDSHFLRTLGIPLVRGRDFSDADTANGSKVALISQEFVRRFFPSEDPVGKRVHIGAPANLVGGPMGHDTWDDADVEVVGVIGDIKTNGLAEATMPLIVVPYSQHARVNFGFKDIMIRTAAAPHSVEPEIRERLHAMDADMPFSEVQTVDEVIMQLTGGQRFTTVLLTMFTGAGLLLTIVGVYGVVAFLVTQRTHEMAVRVALGASRANVLGLVVRQGLKLAAIGAAIGLGSAWAVRQVTGGLLFGISAVDPATFAGAAATLIAVAAIACAVPGMRAMRVDPARALREQ